MQTLHFPKLLGILVGVALIVDTGSAQTWTVNGGQPTPNNPLTTSANESAVSINPVDGTVAIRTGASSPGTCGNGANCVVTVTALVSAIPSQSLNVSWTTSGFTGAVTCTASTPSAASGWNGVVTTSPVNVTMPSTAGNVTLNLSCSGSNGTASGSATITVGSTGPCTSPRFQPVEPTGGNPGVNIPLSLVGPISFASTNWPGPLALPFPGSNGRDYNLPTMSENTVTAVEFIAPALSTPRRDGKFAGINLGSGGSGALLLGITPCAGEFRYNFNPTNPFRFCSPEAGAEQQTVNWTLQGNNLPLSGDRCELIPGQRYYINIGYLSCSGGCNARVTPTEISNR